MTRKRDAPHSSAARGARIRCGGDAEPGLRRLRFLCPLLLRILTLFLLVLPQHISSHPQCLDFEPPFKPPYHLEFCKEYELFGCCDQETDNTIAERYGDIIDLLDVQGYEKCGDSLKEIMCQVSVLLTHVKMFS